ncbi:MAG: TrmB family transcriptional regulator [Candidatus Aenigmarchaeota archaeon]|nr:TrmB family transcriptional regulator [Candidatus Aenigmarchaeota archaeon]
MIASQKVMDALKSMGLNLYERKLWVALLSRSMSTAGELADISGVPRSRCYDVLESLAAKGFVMVQPSKPMKYVAIEPFEALERAKKRIAQNALETTERITRIQKSDITKELAKIHKQSMAVVRPEDLTGTLHGRVAMHDQLSSILKDAKKSINLMMTEQGLEDLVNKHGHLLQKASKRGVKIKILAPKTKQTAEIAKSLKKYAKIKDISAVEEVEDMAARFALADDDKFLMALTHDKTTHPTQDVGFWANSEHATKQVMQPVFEMIWNKAKLF